MSETKNIERAARQLLEMEEFFAGDFVRKSPKPLIVAENVRDDGSAAGLEEIVSQAAACRQCGLSETRTNIVAGEGNPDARIVFVGEAPGADEDACGRPFVGRAGQLLEKIIGAMGFDRSEIFICNILKCRPPGNRDPKPEEIIRCLPFLQRQLELIRPEVIIALGAHAARTLLNTNSPIGQLRGRFHDYYTSDDAEPIKLMPTYHPAYLLRNYSKENRQRVWDDVKKVLLELDLPVPESNKQ